MNLTELLREARRRNRVSQGSLARRARTSQTHISRIERGDVSPTVDTLGKLFEAMGERLELRARPGPVGNQSAEEIRAELRLTPGERVAQASELSHALTSIAASGPRS